MPELCYVMHIVHVCYNNGEFLIKSGPGDWHS